MDKFAFFVFNGDPMCFIHVLLNALDMDEKKHTVKIILEGASVQLVPELVKPENPLNQLWTKALDKGLLEGVCKACSAKLGTIKAVEELGLPLLDDMSGHPSMSVYSYKGFKIVTF